MIESKPLIFGKISAVMSEVGAIEKRHKNSAQGFYFRGIDDLYAALQPALIAHQVFYVPTVLKIEREERQNRSGNALIYTNLQVEYTFFAEDGSSVKAVVAGEAMDSGDKSTNKAMSAALKYALLQIFCVPTEASEDADTTTHEVAPKNGTTAIAPAKSSSGNVSQFPTKEDLPDKKPAPLSPREECIAQLKRQSWNLKLCSSAETWKPFFAALVGTEQERATLEALQGAVLAVEKAASIEQIKAWATAAWKVSSVMQAQALGLIVAFSLDHSEEQLLNITGNTPQAKDAKSLKTMIANLESFLRPESEAA